MRTKVLLAILTTCAVFFTGCAATAAESQSSASAASQPSLSVSDEKAPLGENPPEQPDENIIMGKITAISETEITLALATSERPERGGQVPVGDGAQPTERQERNGSGPSERPDSATDASTSEPPSGNPGGSDRGSGGSRGGMNLSFTEETATYEFADNISIKNGMDDNGETLGVSNLAIDDVIRVELNNSGQVAAIYFMTVGADGQPPERPGNENSAAGTK